MYTYQNILNILVIILSVSFLLGFILIVLNIWLENEIIAKIIMTLVAFFVMSFFLIGVFAQL